MIFKYKKDGEIKEYTVEDLPADLDSSYEFIERSDKVIRKGNAIPPISDFSLFTLNGADTTDAMLNSDQTYVMLLAKDFNTFPRWNNAGFKSLQKQLQQKQIPLFIVTADKQNAETLFGNKAGATVLLCDGTVIKTAARVNPTYFVMKGADIVSKFSYADLEKNMPAIFLHQ